MVVKALWCARCAPGCSAQDRRHPVSALLARGWEQQTMKQAITIKTDKSYERENTWDCPRNTVRSLGWPRDSRRRLWGRSSISQRGLKGVGRRWPEEKDVEGVEG